MRCSRYGSPRALEMGADAALPSLRPMRRLSRAAGDKCPPRRFRTTRGRKAQDVPRGPGCAAPDWRAQMREGRRMGNLGADRDKVEASPVFRVWTDRQEMAEMDGNGGVDGELKPEV